MPKTWAIKVAIPREPQYEVYLVNEGDDWDGRPVADEFDASDLATDKAFEEFPDAESIQVVDSWVEVD